MNIEKLNINHNEAKRIEKYIYDNDIFELEENYGKAAVELYIKSKINNKEFARANNAFIIFSDKFGENWLEHLKLYVLFKIDHEYLINFFDDFETRFNKIAKNTDREWVQVILDLASLELLKNLQENEYKDLKQVEDISYRLFEINKKYDSNSEFFCNINLHINEIKKEGDLVTNQENFSEFTEYIDYNEFQNEIDLIKVIETINVDHINCQTQTIELKNRINDLEEKNHVLFRHIIELESELRILKDDLKESQINKLDTITELSFAGREIKSLLDLKVLLIGDLSIQKDAVLCIFKNYGFDKKSIEFVEYNDVTNYNFKRIRYESNYNFIMYGPVPHSAKGKNDKSSIIEALKEEGYPEIIDLRDESGNLKVTKSSLKKGVERIINIYKWCF